MRYLVATLGVFVLIGALAAVKYRQIRSLIDYGDKAKKAGPPPESVGTAVAGSQVWEGTLSSVGSIAPVRGVAVSNDAAGIVSQIFFESGDVVRQGQVLLLLDSNVERAQLASATSSRHELGRRSPPNRSRAFDREDSRYQPVPSRSTTSRLVKTSAAGRDADSLQAQINRKIVRAPFSRSARHSGRKRGAIPEPGHASSRCSRPIGAVFVDFSLPQQRLATMHNGLDARTGQRFEGARTRPASERHHRGRSIPTIDSTDAHPSNYARPCPNPDEKLRPGMFAQRVDRCSCRIKAPWVTDTS